MNHATLEKRLVFLTGKGGVGKSTVAAALGILATRRGKRTIICEVAQQERMSSVFHTKGVGYHETEIAQDLYAFSIDPQRALEEYLAGKPVSVPLTNPIGCNVKWEGKDAHWMPGDACDLV